MSKTTLRDRLKAHARELGFDALGIAPAVPPPGYEHYREWLRRGFAADMAYMHKHEAARSTPHRVLEGVRSVLVGSVVYGRRRTASESPRQGKVARYAQGADYHEVLWQKLGELLAWLKREVPEVIGRAVADTAPLLERDYARLAGLGWIGKNTMMIDRKLGSFTVLGALLVDCELEYDPPHEGFHCGTCRRCLDACPTGAFAGPFQLDARKCLSYWTIEHRGPTPEAIAESLDGWSFGCDICQEVCPWNRKAPEGSETALLPRGDWANPDLIEWIEADPLEFRKRLKGTALSRAKRSGLVRNAALVMGERRVIEAIPGLTKLLDDDAEEVREAARWSLGRCNEAALTGEEAPGEGG